EEARFIAGTMPHVKAAKRRRDAGDFSACECRTTGCLRRIRAADDRRAELLAAIEVLKGKEGA
ncbi:MAG TPA: hypothetical protein VGR95_12470, partial [Thermoanaerobaculia bacterium]|nr:hypothetical protein [Thermoanaerobaculia bacterium]